MAQPDDEPGYGPVTEQVTFGDIFKAPFFLDIFVRSDAALLGGGVLPMHLAPKFGKWLGQDIAAGEMAVLSDRLTPKESDRYALAHASFGPVGEPRAAILVSDSCLAATALAQGRSSRTPGGRLLFAPIGTVESDRWQELQDDIDFERMPLPPHDELGEYPVAELRNAFPVAAQDLVDQLNTRILACNLALEGQLEDYWGAYARRRGPLAYERNLLKLAWLLDGAPSGNPSEDTTNMTDAIAEVLDLAGAIEGNDLEDVSDADERVRFADADPTEETPKLVERIVGNLRDLALAATTAADELERH